MPETCPAMPVTKIISGGQTGADRGGLEAAIRCNVPHGGWCPHGRQAEDGVVPEKYRLREMDSPEYQARTEANVLDADATVIFTQGAPTGGSFETIEFCRITALTRAIPIAEPLQPESRTGFADKEPGRPKAATRNRPNSAFSTLPGIGSPKRPAFRIWSQPS